MTRAPWPIEVGLFLPQVALDRQGLLDRALLAESAGLHSLWLYDHLYSPGQPTRPSFEAWTAATYLLARTERLRIGHLVLDNNFRHPALVAKMIATLDVLSGGRVEVGLGSGSVRQEHEQLGLPWSTASERAARLGEALEIITRMLAEPITTYDGTHYQVTEVPNVPAPIQRPRPPIHVGGVGPKFTIPLVARFADVWNIPTYGIAGWEESRRRLEDACSALGRDPSAIRVSLQGVLALAPDDASLSRARAEAERRYGSEGWGLEAGGFVGTPPMVLDRIRELADMGVSLFVFVPHDRADPRTMGLLADQVLPELT